MDLSGPFLDHWYIFAEVGAAVSVLTRLCKQLFPKANTTLWHFAPIFFAALSLIALQESGEAGMLGLHAVATGGMSSNLRDLFVDGLTRQAGKTAKLTVETTDTTVHSEAPNEVQSTPEAKEV